MSTCTQSSHRNHPESRSSVESSLESYTEALPWTPSSGELERFEYALFSRAGFTESLRTAAEERDDLRLFELDDVVDALRK